MKNRSLKFYYSKFPVADIEKMIKTCPEINNFVFSYYSDEPADYLQLIVYAEMGKDESKTQYSSYTETLSPFRGQALEITGPVIISNNYITIEAMNLLIGTAAEDSEKKPDYLVFTPGLDDTNHIFYSVTAFIKNDEGDKITEGPGYIITNPSPPATMPV